MLKKKERYGNVVKISKAVDYLFQESAFQEKDYQKAFAVFTWKKLNTKIINKHTQKVYVQGSYLYVQIKYSVLRHELYMLKETYLSKINSNLKGYKIKDIIFK